MLPARLAFSTHVPCRKWDFETIRRGVWQSVYGIRPEIVILALFAITDNWRTCGFELLNRVPDRVFVKGIKLWVGESPVSAIALINSKGLGMFPIGSVGIFIGQSAPIISIKLDIRMHPSCRIIEAATSYRAVIPTLARSCGRLNTKLEEITFVVCGSP
jgi:hypothetical protein